MIINGKQMAEEALVQLAGEIKKMAKPPKLAGVLVGAHAGSRRFLELKKKAAEKIGMGFALYEFPEEVTARQLKKEISNICENPAQTAVILELPLPFLEVQKILNAIPAEKDADVLSAASQGYFFSGQSKILPPAAEGVKMILEKYQIDLKGKNCAVFGYGLLVGRPVSHWLASQGGTVSVINEFTANPEIISSQADILISGVGRADLISGAMVKKGVTVIDFGYENNEGVMKGDVNFEEVRTKAALITPVPGGVGPLVVAAILKNCLILASQFS